MSRKLDGTCIAGRIWGRADGNSEQWDTDGVCPGLDCRAFMTFILCCPVGTQSALRPPPIPPAVVGRDWIANTGGDSGDAGADGFISYAGALEFCAANGGDDICPYDVICPDGAGSPPYKGRRSTSKAAGNDQWAPYSGDGDNKWVQTGIWSGDPVRAQRISS